MSDLLERLEQRAAPADGKPTYSGLNYNYPLAWYRTPNADIVQLQSDPNNRTMYEDLGFVFLRPSEVREWLEEVRPNVVVEQKRRARVITEIRKLAARIPLLTLTDDEELEFPTMPIEELEERFRDICQDHGVKPRLPAIKPDRAPSGGDSHLSGVETGAGAELDSKLQRGQGYDPLKEARRR